MVPRHDGEAAGGGVVAEVGVVAGSVDVVEVVHDLLEGEVAREGLHVEALGQLGGELLVGAVVDEVEELDQRREVVVAGLLVEDVGVGVRVVAAPRPVAAGLGLVEQAGRGEVLLLPPLVEVLHDQPQPRVGAVDAERRRDRVLARQPRLGEQVERQRLVERGLGGVGPDDELGPSVD